MRLKFILITLLLISIVYIFLNNFKNINIQKHLDKETLQYSLLYNTLYEDFKDRSKLTFDLLIDKKEIYDTYKGIYNYCKKNGQTLNNEKLLQMRKKLYAQVQNSYYKLNKLHNKPIIHFHTVNNVSFLRMHLTEKYGDDLTQIRPLVAQVNKTKKFAEGFEVGKSFSQYRFIFPIIDENNIHLGSVEIAYKVSIFAKEYMEHANAKTNIHIVKKIVDEKFWNEKIKVYYKESPLKGMYTLKKAIKNLENYNNMKYEKMVTSLEAREKIIEMIQLKKEAFSIYDYKMGDCITVIPIVNPATKNAVAYLTTKHFSKFIKNEIDHFNNNLIMINSFISIIMFLLYIYLVNQQKNSKLLSKTNLELSKKKNELEELNSNLEDLVEKKTAKLLKQKSMLKYQAHHDALTSLPNRTLFQDRLEQSIKKAKRNKSKVGLLFIDLDNFKEINDSLGHDVGDKILKIVTKRLNTSKRSSDTLARLGGDEFMITVEELHHTQDLSSIANKVLQSLSQPMDVDDHTLYVTSSIGISIYPDDDVLPLNLLKYADSAMYKAKAEGRNNFQYYNSKLTELAFERVVMETNLRSAIKNNEFVVFYQPQVNGKTNRLEGIEALVRWNHPQMGLVGPSKFIRLAESTGLIIEIDTYTMKTAMTQISNWYKQGLNPGKIALNISINQLNQKDFTEKFKHMLEETHCKHDWVELEVTESQVMTHPEETITILESIRNLGIELAIDDFGTGYSSLAYLKKLPINKLKIDQEFVRDLPDNKEDEDITKAIIALAKSLNLKIIAEGVETKAQKDFIVENGCDNIQGYYYSKPVSANELENILKYGFK